MTSDPNNSAQQPQDDIDLQANANADVENDEFAEEFAAADQDAELAAELAKAQITIKDYWDQIVRLNAEMENYRKRAQRDVENAHKYAVKSFVESLLPVADSMDMGLSAASAENANLDSIKEGIGMTLNLFQQTLEKNGVKPVDAQDQPFDPEQHQAISMQPSNDVEPNTVLTVMQKGYLLNDRLVRPAMVVVSSAKTS
ncbi:MAG: nucleotide exchange factor GrpE [Gammaproteobacteria bacterium]|nr:nucleotide exchange factor GrpE [Gammaproteobacteria bacterium]MBL6998631.1 nucleotide exchange factor GrpE [Gammaproteobacteria bacterium]